jgi:outer membrane protein assembly factor BamD (BamD/ComL family)
MNKARRKILNTVARRLVEIEEQLEEITALVDDFYTLKDEIEGVMEEEREAYGNLSEGAQNGERGQAMEEAIRNMEQAQDGLTDLISALESLELASIVNRVEAAAE